MAANFTFSCNGTKQSASFPSLSQTHQDAYRRNHKQFISLNQKSNLKQTRPFFEAATTVLLLPDKQIGFAVLNSSIASLGITILSFMLILDRKLCAGRQTLRMVTVIYSLVEDK
jgi:hypothetical protein